MAKASIRVPEVRVEVRLRNNVLWHAIYGRWESVNALCTEHGLPPGAVGNLLNLSASPKLRDGTWRPLAIRLAEITRVPETTLFPMRLYSLPARKAVAEVPVTALPASAGSMLLLAASPSAEEEASARSDREAIGRALATLSDREQFVLNRRFGLDGEEPETFDEVSERCGVTRERVRQIEIRALDRLRQLPRSRIIHGEPEE